MRKIFKKDKDSKRIFTRRNKFISVLVALILIGAYFTILQKPNIPKFSTVSDQQKNTRIEDMPGVTNVKRFSDKYKTNETYAVNINRNKISNKISRSIQLPYPRIQINYSFTYTKSIRGIKNNNTYTIASLDIRNFGYRYFDADPMKFRIYGTRPLTNISTGNTLDAIIPNNSRAQGDLIFLTPKSGGKSLAYIDNSYKILYNYGNYGGSAGGSGGVSPSTSHPGE